MANDPESLARRDGAREERVRRLEQRLLALETQLRGNGDGGLKGRLDLCLERIEALQLQWKWIVGVLTTVAVAVAQAALKR